jgi:hypothetical protein
MKDLHVSHTLGYGRDRGTGTPEDTDEVNKQEVYECDEKVCDRGTAGVPSIFKIIRSDPVFLRLFKNNP